MCKRPWKIIQHSTYTQEQFEDTNRIIRSRKSKKDRQYNGQKIQANITHNDLQNSTANKWLNNMNPTGKKWG